jgi:hypothetical protein
MELWTAWTQGYDNAPSQVKQVFKLWESLNPDCNLNILDQTDISKILDELKISQNKMSPQVATNIARTYSIAKKGGAWVDATLLPTKPIKTWLTPELLNAGFFAFRSSGDPNLRLQNWFLAAVKGNELTHEWLNIYADYFRSPRYYPNWKRALYHLRPISYFQHKYQLHNRNTAWFADPKLGRECRFYPYAAHNYNLSYLINSNSNVEKIWEKVPFKTMALPLILGTYTRDNETNQETLKHIIDEVLPLSPIHKLQRNENSAIAINTVFEKNRLSL